MTLLRRKRSRSWQHSLGYATGQTPSLLVAGRHPGDNRPRLHESKTSNFLSNFLLLSENYESLAHEIDPREPEEDTDSVK